jgi:hypothetical protein
MRVYNPDCSPFTTVEASCAGGCLKAFERCFGCGTRLFSGGFVFLAPLLVDSGCDLHQRGGARVFVQLPDYGQVPVLPEDRDVDRLRLLLVKLR